MSQKANNVARPHKVQVKTQHCNGHPFGAWDSVKYGGIWTLQYYLNAPETSAEVYVVIDDGQAGKKGRKATEKDRCVTRILQVNQYGGSSHKSDKARTLVTPNWPA